MSFPSSGGTHWFMVPQHPFPWLFAIKGTTYSVRRCLLNLAVYLNELIKNLAIYSLNCLLLTRKKGSHERPKRTSTRDGYWTITESHEDKGTMRWTHFSCIILFFFRKMCMARWKQKLCRHSMVLFLFRQLRRLTHPTKQEREAEELYDLNDSMIFFWFLLQLILRAPSRNEHENLIKVWVYQ